mgnify:CR=1 FL=1
MTIWRHKIAFARWARDLMIFGRKAVSRRPRPRVAGHRPILLVPSERIGSLHLPDHWHGDQRWGDGTGAAFPDDPKKGI